MKPVLESVLVTDSKTGFRYDFFLPEVSFWITQNCVFVYIFVIYVFVNAQKVVHPRGLNHMSFVISAVTTTQCSMKKLEKLSWKKNLANKYFVIYVFVNAQKVVHPRGLNHMSFVISAVTTTQCSMRKLGKLSFMDFWCFW